MNIGVVSVVVFLIVQGRGAAASPQVDTYSVVHPHSLAQGVVSVSVVVCVSIFTSDPTITSEAQDSGSDGAPLGLGEGDGAGVQGQDVGSGGHGVGSLVNVFSVAWIEGL
jgi:hypothetical protein